MFSTTTLSILALVSSAFAGFSQSSTSNVAVYWGQNSAGQQGSQKNLSTYCSDPNIDIIPMAFLTNIKTPSLNLANIGDTCATFSNGLLHCPNVGQDIENCQAQGKTILLSIGGATYYEGGFDSDYDAVAAAQNIWAMFGPPGASGVNRPFDNASVNGFDLDFESTVQHMPAFANELRSLMDAAGPGHILSAAPQCPYPDAADGPMLAGATKFDIIWVQFYNNWCGLQNFVSSSNPGPYNFDTWDSWAKNVSANPNVKVMIGAPGSPQAAGSGYVSSSQLASIISYSKQFSSFGGVMFWDASQLYTNNPGYLSSIKAALTSAQRMMRRGLRIKA